MSTYNLPPGVTTNDVHVNPKAPRPKPRYVETTWELWSYDVWGNKVDGYEVNDRSCFAREYEMRLVIRKYNEGHPSEFEGAYPSDRQIREAFGLNGGRIYTDGDDLTVYVNRAKDGFPIGEMHCTSHESLSPIRKAGK